MIRMTKAACYGTIILLTVVTVSGCMQTKNDDPEDLRELAGNITILVPEFRGGNQAELYPHLYKQQVEALLVKPFQEQYPHVQFSFVTYDRYAQTDDSFVELVEYEKPDVIMMDERQFQLMIASDKLLPLKNKQPLDIHPAVLQYLEVLGQGEVYGLTPLFDTNVLYYNKQLFDRYQVPYPQESGMTWQELFDLAGILHAKSGEQSPVYGLYQAPYGALPGGELFNLVSKSIGVDTIASPVNEEANRMLATIVQGYVDGSIAPPARSIPPGLPVVLGDLGTIKQKTAMTVEGKDFLAQRLEFDRSDTASEWGIAKLPAGSGEIEPDTIVGINGQTEQGQAAWEFVRFIHRPETIRSLAASENDILLSSVPPYQETAKGIALAPFFGEGKDGGAIMDQNPLQREQWNREFTEVVRYGLDNKLSEDEIVRNLRDAWSKID